MAKRRPSTRSTDHLPRKQSRRRGALGLESLERRELLALDLIDIASGGGGLSVLTASDEALSEAAADFFVQRSGNRATFTEMELTGDRNDPAATGFALLDVVDPGTEYRLIEVKHGLASSHARFNQVVDGVTVFGSTASVHLGPDGAVQTLHVDARSELNSLTSIDPAVSFDAAAAISSTANEITAALGDPKGELIWYPTGDGDAALAWKTMVASIAPVGDFQTIVDAATGKVLSKKNLAVFDTGTGDVYEPNPYQTQGSGTGLSDNGDATSAALDAQLTTVTLQRLDSGTGLIKGQWVDLSTLNSPTLADVDANEPSRVYQYTRDDARFEQVVIYHSIDAIQAYIHTLGFDDDTGVPNGIRDFPTLANAHWDNNDQSFYSTGNDAVHFGDGGVDDGEDADIIAHEYGHAIQHDQNASWGGGEMGAMGEGFGDYLAASFYAGDGNAAYQSSHAACVGEWDATSYSGTNPPCLRRVDGSKTYPDDLVGQVHADGEIWSAALWDIRASLGAFTTDQLVLEHHFALPAAATMPDAAQAILTADVNLNSGANQAAILQAFVSRGILQAGPAGIVEFDSAVYGVGDTITITLRDSDLVGSGPVNVGVTSTGGDSETVTLAEVGGGEFTGTIASGSGAVVTSNGSLEVTTGEEITVTYNDADDGTGNPAVATDTAIFQSFINLLQADFTDDFGVAFDEGFTVSGPANEWHLSTGRANDLGHTPDDSFYFGSGEGPFGGGTHNNNSDGTLTSPPIDLTDAVSAELNFNHFLESEASFDFASISIIHGPSTTEIATSSNGSLPVATTGFESETFDLTGFIGQEIQIAFRFTSDISVTNEGWYIDDVIVRAVIPNVNLQDVFVADFSDDQNNPFDEGFAVSGPANEWHLSTGRGNDAGHTADDSFYFGSGEGPAGGGTHGNNSDGTITSPLIDLTNAISATLSFNHFLESEASFDFATVSIIGDSSTTQIATSENASLPVATTGFENALFDLTAFVGQSIRVAFRFTSDGSVVNEGWYVDDVVVQAEVSSVTPTPNSGEWINQGPIGANHRFLENLSPGNSVGGATHTVLAHPTNADILYVGTVNGGIWKTTNATDPLPIWEPQTDFLPSLSIGAMAFDPTDLSGNTLVAATARYSSFGGVGGDRGAVYRTTDGGTTWTDPGSVGLFGENLSGVAVRGNTIVLTSSAFGGGILRSTDGGATFNVIADADFVDNDNFSDLVEDPTSPNRLYAANSAGGPGGIYRSDDFGATWSKITGPAIHSEMDSLVASSNNIEMAVSPQTGRLYVAVLLSSQPEAIYHTNNASSASPTWTRMDIPVLPQGGGVAISGASNTSPIVITSPSHGLTNPNRGVHFVVIDGVTGNTAANGFHRINVIDGDTFELTGTTGNGTYTGGGTWTKVAGPNPTPKNEPESGAQGRTHFSIVVDPNNEDIVYLGGDRQDSPNLIGGATISGAIFRGDASLPSNPNVAPSPQWDHLTHDIVDFDPSGGTASGSAPHADSREMVFDAAGNLIEVDDGGIYKRTSPTDNTGDWFSLIGNLAATEFHDVAYDTISNTIIGGLQDNGTLYQPAAGATFWNILSGGDGGDVAVDDVSLAASNQSIRYTSFQNLGSFRKTTWDGAGNLLNQTFPALNVTAGANPSPFFNTPVALNHVDPTRLLFGMANGVYESTDQGENIAAVATIVTTGSTSGNAIDYGGRSSGVDNPDVAYIGDFDGNVHVRTTSGGAFTSSNPSGGSTENIVDVMMDPSEWQTAFAIDFNQVFTTTNNGGLWSDITGNLASIGASGFRSLQYVSGAIDALILGTNVGVYASLVSSLGTWFAVGNGLPNAVVFDLDYDAADDVLVAGTMGRGVWLLDNASERLIATGAQATVTLDGSNNLVISNSGGDQTDDLMIQSDTSSNQFVITGFDQTITTGIAGATGSGTDVVTIPFSQVTGSNIIIDTLGGRDLLTIDFDLGNFSKQIQYNGGDPATGRGDTLALSGGGTFTTATYDFTGTDSGAINITGNATITYTGLEPIDSDLDVQDVVLNYTDAAETIWITPHGESLGRIHAGSSAAENVSFPTPTASLVILGGDVGDNTINILGAFDLDGASVDITGDAITMDGAAFLTHGNGSITVTAERNLFLDDNTRLVTVDGNITLTANTGVTPATGDFNGIFLDHASISTVNGDVLLTGRGGDEVGGSFNRGVYLSDLAKIESTGTGPNAGTITIIGRGGDAANGNRGVQLDSAGTRISSVDGDISISGTGGDGTAGFNQGIIFFDGVVESTGTGADAATITLDGSAGAGVGSNAGVFLIGPSAITSPEGNISIIGQGNGSGDFNSGVVLSGNVRVQSTGTGGGAATITIDGTGGDANQSNRGIRMSGATDSMPGVTSIDGNIDLTGLGGNGAASFNHGIAMFTGLIQSTGQADVSLTGTADGAGGNGIGFFTEAAVEATAGGNVTLLATRSGTSSDFFATGGLSTLGSPSGIGTLTLTANIMTFDDILAIQGAGDLVLQPRTSGTSIGLGGGPGTLNINDTELSNIVDGLSQITIGDATAGTGAVDLDTATFNDPVTIVGGSIDVNALNAGSNDVHLIARTGNITNQSSGPDITGGVVTLTGNVAPGQSPGILTVDGNNFAFDSGDTYAVEIGGTTPGRAANNHDQVNVIGSVAIGSNVSLAPVSFNGFTPAVGDSFVIVNNDLADAIVGTFAGLPEGASIGSFLGSGLSAVISYQGGDGNDVVLTATELDFGDAPAPYPTLLVDGARHQTVGPRLGSGRDAEFDGQPTANADGDDNAGDDEDGVMFGVVRASDTMAGVNIDLQNAANARVDAWLDFDGNGVWDPTDQILDNVPVTGGLQTLNFSVPAGATLGTTYARVRVSTDGDLDPTGLAADGEVEDYQVEILASAPEVESVVLNGGDTQRSTLTELVVTFDREVTAPASAFTITNTGSATVVNSLVVNSSVVGGKTVTVLTFAPGTSVQTRANGNHSLVDGDYQLDIAASQIAEVGGGPNMANDYVFGNAAIDKFFRKYGDMNGNNLVELFDFAAFRGTYLLPVAHPDHLEPLDNEGNGSVNLFDFAAFRNNFGS